MDEQYFDLMDRCRNLIPIMSIEGEKEITDARPGRGFSIICYPFPVLCGILTPWGEKDDTQEAAMEIEKLKNQLRALLHQRDMLSYERDSMELDDLRMEIEEEIQKLHQKLRMTA